VTADAKRVYNRAQYQKHGATRRLRRRERYWANPEKEREAALGRHHRAMAARPPEPELVTRARKLMKFDKRWVMWARMCYNVGAK
jgi:hypothetical protein